MALHDSRLRIVIGNKTLWHYPEGGGHWMVRLQYLLGLRALGHEPFLFELMPKSGDDALDEARLNAFFTRCHEYGLADSCVVLLHTAPNEQVTLDDVEPVGCSEARLRAIAASADLFWNDCDMFHPPLMEPFGRRVLVDLDPGHMQVSGLDVDLGLDAHDAFLTVGLNLGSPSCESPTLGRHWEPFNPFVHLPLWDEVPDAPATRPFTSVTHWEWGEIWWGDRVLSISKRDGLLPFVGLPSLARRPFELAAMGPPDADRELLAANGWNLVDPWEVARTPVLYQDYIASSRAEISCPKPIFAELRTGWFSDRSACYLAAGRPVLARDTGFSDHLPVGEGLLAFETLDEAVEGVKDIDADYGRHARAARALAHDLFDARLWLPRMIEASFSSEPEDVAS